MQLTDKDRELIHAMREAGMLANVDAHRLDQKNGIILVACADGDQMPDLFQFQEEMEKDQRGTPRVHTLALNGGALLLPTESPLNKNLHEDEVLMEHLRGAEKLKGIKTVALYAHAPCGMAAMAGLDFEAVVRLLIAAKNRIKSEIPDLKVACFVHVDKGDGKKRTYFVSRTAYEAKL